jgi:hypothetical protein
MKQKHYYEYETNEEQTGNESGACQCEFRMLKNHRGKTARDEFTAEFELPEPVASRQYGPQLCDRLCAKKSCSKYGFLSRIGTVNNLGIRANRLS